MEDPWVGDCFFIWGSIKRSFSGWVGGFPRSINQIQGRRIIVKRVQASRAPRAGDSGGALSFLLPENSRKSVNSEGDNTLSKTAIFLSETIQFCPQREAGDSGGALSFLLSEKSKKSMNPEGHSSFLKKQFSLLKQANFCPSVRPANSADVLSFLLPENSRKSVNSKGDNSLFKTAIFLYENKPIFCPSARPGILEAPFYVYFGRGLLRACRGL